MKRHIFLLCIASLSLALSASDDTLQEILMRTEILTRNNPNITQQTHPTLYGVIKELSEKAQVAMPRYISLYDGEFVWMDNNGFTHEGMYDIGASVDLLGDLNICKKIVLDLPYKTVKGILATAIAAKALNALPKAVATGFCAWGAACLTALAYDIDNSSIHRVTYRAGGPYVTFSHQSTLGAATVLGAIAGLVAGKLYSNNVQKAVDLHALQLTDAQSVIDGIQGEAQTTDAYVKENIFSRLTSDSLKKLYRALVYPVRSYTSEERVAYLKKAVASQARAHNMNVI